jgi:hypothetical protein
MDITYSGYSKSEPLTNFPVLVILGTNIEGFSYSDFRTAGGVDLRFTDSTRTNELNYEIEAWDPTGFSYVWVQVPRLTSNTTIYAYWGMPADAPAYTTNGATWDSHFVGVWHMHSSTNDSTSHRNNGNEVGAVSLAASGQADGAIALTNTTDTVVVPYSSSLGLTSNGTYEAWVKFRLFQDWQGWEGFIHKGGNPTFTDEDITLQLRYTGHVAEFAIVGGRDLIDGGNILAIDRWYYLTGAWSLPRNYTRLFVDASLRVADACSVPAPDKGGPVCIGSQLWDGNYGLNGWMDEVRISDIDRSPSWIWATWMTLVSNDVFAVPGTIQTRLGGTIIMIM